jgi:predicted dehydrogenase
MTSTRRERSDRDSSPTIRWGICGTGRMANVVAAELAELSGSGPQLRAVGSRSREAAEAFAAHHGIPRAHSSYAALARDPDVDIVYLATPPSLHCENALACIEHGKAVLCEKPFALNGAETARMIRAARDRRVFLMEAMWTRFLPAIAAVREVVNSGSLGAIRLVIGGGGFVPVHDPRLPLFDKALGGGVLLDAGVYLISLTSMLLGPPAEVVARGKLGPSSVDEQDVILLNHAGGAQAVLYVSLATRRSPDLEILGEKGRLRIEAPVYRPTRLTLQHGDEAPAVSEHPVAGSGYRAELVEVTSALASGRRESLVMPLRETLSIMQTLDTVRATIGLVYPRE